MQTQSKHDFRENLLVELQSWHSDLGIKDFPKRFGISTNEKKFREVSFRVKDDLRTADVSVEDIIVSQQPIYGLGHSIVGYNITYRVWLPTSEGKFPGTMTIRFSLYRGIVGLVKVNDYIIAIKHDNFPLQNKTIDLPRMHGVSSSTNLDTLAKLLITKEFPFFIGRIESMKVEQLGDSVFHDPSTRNEETISLLIEINLKEKVKSKEELEEILDPKNKDLLLYKVYTEAEVKNIIEDHLNKKDSTVFVENPKLVFRDQYSLWTLVSYFHNK